MDRFENMSRDDLRSEVSKLKVIKYNEMKKLNKQQLINVLRENQNNLFRIFPFHDTIYHKYVEKLRSQQKHQPIIQEQQKQQLKDIFPFEQSVFSNYKEFRDTVKETTYENESNTNELHSYFERIKWQVIDDIKKVNVKITFTLEVQMGKPGTDETITFYVRTKNQPLLQEDDKEEFYSNVCYELEDKIEKQELKGSGWSFSKANNLLMTQNVYKQFKGGSYIPLPKWIANKKAIVNIKNIDEKCFMWCLLAALHPAKIHPERVNHYRTFENELLFEGISFPIRKKDISKIEKINNLAVNVFSNEDNSIIPIYISKNMKKIPKNRIIDLFLIKLEERMHYCWIKNINALLGNEVNNHTGKNYICRWCFNSFQVKTKYERHVEECSKNKPVVFKKPQENFVQFENIQRSQKIPYVIYADFESIIKKYASTSNNPNESWTETKGKHIASAFCAVVVDFNGKIVDIEVYRGYNAGEKFNDYIIKMCDYLINLKSKSMKKLTKEQWKLYNDSITCPECKEEYSIKNPKVRDHDHFSGEFRGPLCNRCNLANEKARFIPVFFHNLKGYDSHLILSSINEEIIKKSDINVIPNNSEKYISFSYRKPRNENSKLTYEIRFLDSFSFMASSLDSLSKNLADDQFLITKQFYQNDEEFNLMKRKGIYPYEYMNSFKKYEETELPNKDMFYDELNNKNCSMEDYEYAKLVYNKMECKNLGDYTDIYMINDVLMLADVFETFRETCMNYYKLDPCWYYTAPGLAWDAMLKITKIKLQTIKDYDMYLFIEKGIRGGMVNSVKRYSKANNKYMKDYNPDEASKYLMYLDANNLYGWAMIQKLPHDEF